MTFEIAEDLLDLATSGHVMKRTTTRRQTLPAFRFTVGQAEVLERELRQQFQGDVDSYFSITVGADEYRFDTTDEIQGATDRLPPVVHDFSLWMRARSGDNRYVSVRASGQPSVFVEASDYGWCEAVVATCRRATQGGKRWYSGLRAWHFLVLAFIVGNFPGYLVSVLVTGKVVGSFMWALARALSAILLWILLSVIFIAFDRVFPWATLVIREEESWAKRRSPELTVILGLATLVVAVLTLLLK